MIFCSREVEFIVRFPEPLYVIFEVIFCVIVGVGMIVIFPKLIEEALKVLFD